ncbi:tRNA dihydrouridine synthase [[Clostridium] polysaccharolyticum]|uniref:tRNA-dihydrouridine synthase n=1 Tax=[Clostridium] polysaccharolyticum TaxID=29364 RepID=A0A1I0EXJ0_9FIRM|nr:tRNA-dihydrouridine synthase family protein [[Clostridium] polysaccharolyticum]SET50379.1 tRNA-U20a,U20b-dihydrouridine synthase [[Clostridium] polysaccharolyticum]
MDKLYFAPLEGVTGYVYRNAHKKYFGNIDKYFLPFIVTSQTGKLKSKELRDILPENNKEIVAVPQILSNNAEQFLKMAHFLEGYGYREINLNLGCPAKTVVTKKKGSGFLLHLEDLERFLDKVYEGIHVKLSIKTRIGVEDPEEFVDILKLYNQYPIEELIIHPRVQQDYYKNKPNLEVFSMAVKESKNSVCYNGDIVTVEDYHRIKETFPQVESIMIGRGLIRNPALGEEIAKGKTLDKQTLIDFHEELCAGYQEIMSGDRNVLFKMKEVWFYMGQSFTGADKYLKEIRKMNHLSEYHSVTKQLFQNCDLK